MRHYRTHVGYSEELRKAGEAAKGDYPQIYELKKLNHIEMAVRYDWGNDCRHYLNRDQYLIHGRKSWFGLEAWRMALLDNSKRGMS